MHCAVQDKQLCNTVQCSARQSGELCLRQVWQVLELGLDWRGRVCSQGSRAPGIAGQPFLEPAAQPAAPILIPSLASLQIHSAPRPVPGLSTISKNQNKWSNLMIPYSPKPTNYRSWPSLAMSRFTNSMLFMDPDEPF